MPRPRQTLSFVVHKHKATALHYDFRIEVGGVMPSWAIPKGPSLDSSVRRLAMPTSDHDLEYRKFEGVIPFGEPGGGPVMIWDQGTYVPELEVERGVRKQVKDQGQAEEVVKKSLKEGNLKFTLFGKKLKGSFALVRTGGMGGKDAWLLIKHKDRYSKSGYDAKDFDFSATTGRTLQQILDQTSIS